MAKPTLSRTTEDRVIAGVVGGIARRFGWNPTVLRIIYVVGSVLSAAFPGILVITRYKHCRTDCGFR